MDFVVCQQCGEAVYRYICVEEKGNILKKMGCILHGEPHFSDLDVWYVTTKCKTLVDRGTLLQRLVQEYEEYTPAYIRIYGKFREMQYSVHEISKQHWAVSRLRDIISVKNAAGAINVFLTEGAEQAAQLGPREDKTYFVVLVPTAQVIKFSELA